MKAITLPSFGDADVLQLAEVPDPVLRPHDLLVRNHAAGVNRADVNQRQGAYGRTDFGDSALMGLEIAGEVLAVGDAVQGFAPGDRVMGIVGGGAYAELARIDYRMAMPVPAGLAYVEAAAIPEAYVTAHEALLHLGQLRPGERVLIHAAASGVGSAAVQLAAACGAQVFATASGHKLDQLNALGASVLIDYQREDFQAVVEQTTAGGGVDVIVDFIGAPYFERNILSLANGGRLVQVGLLGGGTGASVPLERILYGHLRILGTVMKSRTPAEKHAMVNRFSAHWLADFQARGLKPVVDSVVPLERAAEAHRRMESNQNLGKIVLAVNHHGAA
ncbi:putative PIG3 family NAD(P)H quinone oxidoreductase [Cupriavidus alkaliphilus]|uniref:NAD(P)H-quinone oxidoreductase n=1 Tax=Cupriavidus alkaliphilus TaxID=942866 RepID=UPI000DE727B5|nr:NAD(P)H-quinone oxidoreductase [Cupriavidus alkaliphilus]PVY77725.1 putative PIG3 family NAD(P)H quinone oxidoreductase [Cupriavidus alkaliphilus]